MLTSHAALVGADWAWRTLVEPSTYSINAMPWGTVELEPEVRDWLEQLPVEKFATVAFYVDLLSEEGPLLGEPYTRQLDGSSASFVSISIDSQCV